MSCPDVEKQQPREDAGESRSRTRVLDCCLLVSVGALFVLLFGASLCAVMFYRSLRDDVSLLQQLHTPPDPSFSALRESQPQALISSYKAQNIAYLRATSAQLKEGVIAWESFPYAQGQTVGSRYKYNTKSHLLTVRKEGSYFLYVQLKLKCDHKCGSYKFTVDFEDQTQQVLLSCPVELKSGVFNPEPTKCWTVIPHLNKDSQVVARLKSKSEHINWSLQVNSSGFGMFLVDGPTDD